MTPNMKQEDVERTATEYAGKLGLRPFVLEGSEYFADRHPLGWNVYFGFCEEAEELIGLPGFFCVHVDDSTGEASHIPHL